MNMMRWMKAWMMRRMRLPSCQEIQEFAYDYLEGELERTLQQKFEKHLRGCRDCRAFVSTYWEVAMPEGRLLTPLPLDPEFQRRVVQFLKENR